MRFDPSIHHRRSIRLAGYDYSQDGYYYITLCTHQRRFLFGKIIGGKMVLSKMGLIVRDEWVNTQNIRKNVKVDKFIIMPDHIHGILIIDNNDRGVWQYALTDTGVPTNQGVLPYAPTYAQTNPGVPTTPGVLPYAQTNPGVPKNQGVLPYAPTYVQTGNANRFRSPAKTVGSIIRGFKSVSTKKINLLLNTPGQPVWQKNYYEHIIRSEKDYLRIFNYIKNNPLSWEKKNRL